MSIYSQSTIIFLGSCSILAKHLTNFSLGQLQNKTPFLAQLKQIFGPSYFVTALVVRISSQLMSSHYVEIFNCSGLKSNILGRNH